MAKVVIDKEACVGCGLCEGACPEVFEIGSDDVSCIREGVEPDVNTEIVKSAITGCPMEAIKIEQ